VYLISVWKGRYVYNSTHIFTILLVEAPDIILLGLKRIQVLTIKLLFFYTSILFDMPTNFYFSYILELFKLS
jgi:uncharacterized membrane protein YfhO